MLVREIMHREPLTVGPVASLEEAYALMVRERFRHLPVLEGDRLVGVVTDRDLRLATSRLAEAPFAPDARVGEVMTRPVQTVHPLDPVESAARTMRELKIGCLPVVDNGRLVGIVTGIDILDALLLLTGVHRPSGRLELRLEDRPGELARLTRIVAERGVNIHSILSYPDDAAHGRIVLRVLTMETRTLAKTLCDAGFEVVWPPATRCAS
jgi:acetoin utilization protein AcuB